MKAQSTTFTRVTPNLIVADMERSLSFYRDALGFTQDQTVPEQPPYIFVWLKAGDASVFLNAKQDPPAGQPDLFAGRQIGGTLSLYIVVDGIEELLKKVQQKEVKIAVPLHTEFYGMKEFAVFDPDGYLLIFAEEQKD